MWVAPLVRSEPRDDEQRKTDDQVGDQHVDPDLEPERRQEREEARRVVHRALEENADAEVHERLGEVDNLFTYEADRHRRDRDVCFLSHTRT